MMDEIKIDDSLPLPVEHCPYCGGDGCTATRYDYIISKWVTDFHCDECCGHTTIIHHIYDTLTQSVKGENQDE